MKSCTYRNIRSRDLLTSGKKKRFLNCGSIVGSGEHVILLILCYSCDTLSCRGNILTIKWRFSVGWTVKLKEDSRFHMNELFEEKQSLLGSCGNVVQANIPSDCIAWCVPRSLCESVHVTATSKMSMLFLDIWRLLWLSHHAFKDHYWTVLWYTPVSV